MILLRLKIKRILFASFFFRQKHKYHLTKPERYEGLFTGKVRLISRMTNENLGMKISVEADAGQARRLCVMF